MEHDPSLAESIRSLLVKGMTEKLNALVEAWFREETKRRTCA
jgi:hypothetical protein